MAKLSVSKMRYIKVIYELDLSGKGARISDIADKLGVTKPSVCKTIVFLQQEKLVTKNIHHQVSLTPAGKSQAELIMDKFLLIKRFLTEVFIIDEKNAGINASILEPAISMDICHSMRKFLSRADC